jgi:hypothetical protein
MAINDGSQNALTGGSISYPNLLDGYAVRPSWGVAGVDYAVGATSTAVKDPATISMAGVSVNTSTRTVFIEGNNVTLDGYDFSLHGGYQVVVLGANDTISNSNFKAGSNSGGNQIYGAASSSNLTIKYSTMDGTNTGALPSLVQFHGSGTVTLEYNHFKDFSNHVLELAQANGSPSYSVVYKNNLIEQGATSAGQHLNFLQFGGGTATSVDVEFNTTYQTPQVSGGEGFQFYNNTSGGVIQNAVMANNTMIATGGNTGSAMSYMFNGGPVNQGSMHDNFFDLKAAWGAFYAAPAGWSFSNNIDMRTSQVVNSNNTESPMTNPPVGTPPPVTTPPGPSAPSVPTITSFKESGVVANGTTNHNTLTVTGTAVANSTVTVFDGTAKIGTATANGSGAWSFATATLADGKHSFTATDTSSGKTSAASSALAVTIDTHAPAVPVLVSDSVVNTNHVLLSGTAEANSTITVYDGTTAVGSATAGSNGAWSVTTSALTIGSKVLTATATDAAGNTSVHSQPLDPVVGSPAPGGGGSAPGGGGSAPGGGGAAPGGGGATPSAPKIVSFSPDSGVVGDHITNHNTLTLTGTAAANTTVEVFDGTKQIGTTKANGSGAWNYTTAALSDGNHSLTAKDTDSSGHTSSASSALAVTIDTHAPAAPTMAVYSKAGTAVGGTTTADDLLLKGTAEANSTIHVLDGGKQIGTATTNGSGLWSFDTGHIANGSHSFTSTATDVAGNASAVSAVKGVTVQGPASGVAITDMSENSSHIVTIKGTADAYSHIKVYDGTQSVGQVNSGADGTWSFTSSSALSNKTHTFTANELDSTGHVVASSGNAILSSSNRDTLQSTAGNDLFVANGHHDTFVFASNFGKDVITDFRASGHGHDVIQFSKSVFDSFSDVLSHATQSGQNVVISDHTGDSLTLKNVKMTALNQHDFHFA